METITTDGHVQRIINANDPTNVGVNFPVFVDPATLTKEQLTDPDYRLKAIQKEYGGKYSIGCSKCHHCR
jgi:hypothetical protein